MCVSKALEQDKYSLQKEVELKTRMLESLRSDYDCVKTQQRQQLQEQQEHLERSHTTAVNELNNKVDNTLVTVSVTVRYYSGAIENLANGYVCLISTS